MGQGHSPWQGAGAAAHAAALKRRKETVKVMSAKDYLEEAKDEEVALPTIISEKVVKGDKAIEAAKAAVGEAKKAPATAPRSIPKNVPKPPVTNVDPKSQVEVLDI